MKGRPGIPALALLLVAFPLAVHAAPQEDSPAPEAATPARVEEAERALQAAKVPGRSSHRIDARVHDDLRVIEGEVEADVVNDSGATADRFTLWLYPNTFATALAGVVPGNRDYYQPFGPGRGGIDIGEIVVEGVEVIPEAAVPGATPTGTAWGIRLPRPVEPGESVQARITFRTQVPERLGPLSFAHGVLTALGGWHPYLTAGSPDEAELLDRRPRAADWTVRLRLPEHVVALVGGEVASSEEPTRLRAREWVDLAVRPRTMRPIATRHGSYWASRPPPRPAEGTAAMPDPAPLPTEWIGDRMTELMHDLDRWADRQGLLPEEGPIAFVTVPMRSEIALATPGIVAVSDRAFKVMPIPILLRFHGKAIARAYFTRRLLPLVREREAPGMVPQIADALGTIFAERFAEQVLDQSRRAIGVLGVFDFVPSVDDFLRSPNSAFANVYYQAVADPIAVRDEPWTYNVLGPRGRLLREKLEDLFGPFELPVILSRYLSLRGCPPPPLRVNEPGACTLRSVAEEVAGRDLSEFFAAWTERFPEQDLRVRIVSAEPIGCDDASDCDEEDVRFRSVVEVWRIGDTPEETVELVAHDEDGTTLPLEWRAVDGEVGHVFTIESSAPVIRVRVDPRNRVFQTPSEPGELAALGDRDPPRLHLLLTRLSLSYSTADRAFFGDVDVLLRPRDAVRRRLAVGFSYQKSSASVHTGLSLGFGRLVGASRYEHNAGVGIFAALLREGFPNSDVAEGYAVGPTLFYSYDDRLDALTPLSGTAVLVTLAPQAGGNRGGESHFFASTSAGVVRLYQVAYAQAIALRLKGSLLAGSHPVQSLFPLGGSDQGLRGFSYTEVLASRLAILSAEWRFSLVRDIDLDLGFTRVHEIAGALFVDGAAAGGIFRPHAEAPGSRNGLFADYGAGVRLQHALFGVIPMLFGVDAAMPLGRTPSIPPLAPITVQLRAGQAFSTP
ncbi:MAG TPA: hypothetical protein VN033_01575 [Vulgatibacter sp.]|nr:hypothetical protein [Vulgatibacter sp.]